MEMGDAEVRIGEEGVALGVSSCNLGTRCDYGEMGRRSSPSKATWRARRLPAI